MARPVKNGLDYYPVEVGWYKSLTARRVGVKVGASGLVIYNYLLGEIYARGYYVQLDDHFIDNMIYELMPILKDTEDNIKALVNTTIDVCVDVGCFDGSFRQAGILTGKEIQKTYIGAKKNLKHKMTGEFEYSLITGCNGLKPNVRVSSEETQVNSEEIIINSEETQVNSEFSTQRKEKKRKENNIGIYSPLIEQVYDLFRHNKLTEADAERFYDYYDSMQWTYEDGREVRWRHAAVNWIKNIKGESSKVINF